MQFSGDLSPAGPFDGLPITDQAWTPIDEFPDSGAFNWEGSGLWNGSPVTWQVVQFLAMPDPGVYVYFFISDATGYFTNTFYQEDGINWVLPSPGAFTGGLALDWAAPFTPFGRLEVKGRQWHEM